MCCQTTPFEERANIGCCQTTPFEERASIGCCQTTPFEERANIGCCQTTPFAERAIIGCLKIALLFDENKFILILRRHFFFRLCCISCSGVVCFRIPDSLCFKTSFDVNNLIFLRLGFHYSFTIVITECTYISLATRSTCLSQELNAGELQNSRTCCFLGCEFICRVTTFTCK